MEQGLSSGPDILDLTNETGLENPLANGEEENTEEVEPPVEPTVEYEVRKLSVDFTEKLATLEKSLKEQEIKLKESTAEKVSVAVNTEEPKEPENKVQANLMEDMNSLLDTTV